MRKRTRKVLANDKARDTQGADPNNPFHNGKAIVSYNASQQAGPEIYAGVLSFCSAHLGCLIKEV